MSVSGKTLSHVLRMTILTLVILVGTAGQSDCWAQYSVKAQFDVKVPMRDGTMLSCDIYRPDTTGKFPVLLQRTPYGNYGPEQGYRYASKGYVVVMQDVRGKNDSDGKFNPFVNEITDGYDSQQWCGTQSWSNGKVGTYGGSYVGATQWLPARMANEHLSCMFTVVAASDYYRHWIYSGGVFAHSFNTMWGALSVSARVGQNMAAEPLDWDAVFNTLPMKNIPEALGRNVPWFGDWLAHPLYDEYWQKLSITPTYDKISVPVFHIGGWYDIFLEGTLENFAGMTARGATEKARAGQRLIIGPWFHGSTGSRKSGQVDFGAEAELDSDGLQLRWFDHWLKGEDNGVADEKPVKLFVMGENRWREFETWPPATAREQEFFLHADIAANSLLGDGRLDNKAPVGGENVDSYRYDPSDPVPTLGGNDCCRETIVTEGPYDQRLLELRHDVLVYTSEPLESELVVTGAVKMVLWAASSAVNTDFCAKLVDVDPTGKAINITFGILRAPMRNGLDKWEELDPGKPYEMTIELRPTANTFLPGHRVRLEVTSSNFPRFARNLNTAGMMDRGKEEMIVADQQVFHDKKHPSRLILSVLPR